MKKAYLTASVEYKYDVAVIDIEAYQKLNGIFDSGSPARKIAATLSLILLLRGIGKIRWKDWKQER